MGHTAARWILTAAPLVLLPVGAADAGGPEFRSIDGSSNNVAHPDWGSVNVHLLRMTSVAYADGTDDPAGADRPGTREISNAVCAQDAPIPEPSGASNFIWQWGQFIDHDIGLTDVAAPAEPFPIPVPECDIIFDPGCDGDAEIPVDRSIYDPATGSGPGNPRQQINQITAFIDASNVYGSDPVRAEALRTMDGTGRLKMSAHRLLPYNTEGLPNLGGPDPSLFLAGDIRANEQVSLTSMHTLWVREHNRIARILRHGHPMLDGDMIYEMARARVGATIQCITFHEFLPLLLGPDAIEPYAGYDEDMDPSIANEFSAAAYRVGHTLLSSTLLRLDRFGETIPEGNLALRDAFFAPQLLVEEGGIEPILRGLAAAHAQRVDVKVIDDVRNFLFLPPIPSGLDLPAINMQRGRDHGLPGYNQVRQELGLGTVVSFDEISSDPDVVASLASVYDDVDDVDLWLGALAEDRVDGALVGPVMYTIIRDQFTRLRNGDRFWYENVFSGALLAEIQSTRLSDVIRRNTKIKGEIQDDVFRVVPPCTGDLDGNGVVNWHDLVIVLNAWGTSGGPADLNGDGTVDIHDVLLLFLYWGPC